MASSVFYIYAAGLLLQLCFFSAYSTLVFPLSHSLSNTQFNNNTHQLLKSTAARSTTQFRRHQVSLPLNPGSDYTLSFTLGSQIISLYMDTGSDIVWLPCQPFECMLCDGEYNPSTIPNAKPLNITSSTPVTCKSRSCSVAHSSHSSSDLCAMAKCPLELIETSDCNKFKCPSFYYAYGDGSFVANLFTDTLSLSFSSPTYMLKDFTFGCAHSALGEPIGVAGFGRGALSFPAQLATSSPEIGNYFSYCLVSHNFNAARIRKQSPLIFGRRYDSVNTKEKQVGGGSVGDGFVYTPLLKNPKHSYFYCVGLEGMSVGEKRIEAPEKLKRVDGSGNGGMVVDSGTTYTMLPKGFYDTVVAQFDKIVGSVYKRADDVEGRTGLGPCYYVDDSTVSTNKVVPQMVLHFGGNSSVVMPRRNYFYEFLDNGDDRKKRKRKVGCMVLMNGGDDVESGGPAGLLGNYQQQGFEVVYDLMKERVGFAKRKCASLWESLK